MERIMKNRTCVVLLAILCNVLWGSAFPMIKIGYEEFGIASSVSGKILFAGIRFCLAGVLLFTVTFIRKKRLPVISRENRLRVLILALVQTTTQYFFFYLGLANTTASGGSIYNSTAAFMAVIMAHFFFKNDRLNRWKVIGCLLGFAGVLAVTLDPAEGAHFSLAGEGLVLLATAAFAAGSLISKKATAIDEVSSVTAYSLGLGGAVLILLGIVLGGSFSGVTVKGVLVLLYLSLLSFTAFTIWASLLKYNPVGKVAVYNFVIPISTALLSALLLGENVFQLKYLAALVLLTAGIILVYHQPSISRNES